MAYLIPEDLIDPGDMACELKGGDASPQPMLAAGDSRPNGLDQITCETGGGRASDVLRVGFRVVAIDATGPNPGNDRAIAQVAVNR